MQTSWTAAIAKVLPNRRQRQLPPRGAGHEGLHSLAAL